MKLTAGMRVKNGELWAEECLASLSEFVDQIVILDDGSTDHTPDICRGFPKVTHLIRWEKSFFQEGLDRNVVLALAKDTEPDWILFLDIDEVFEEALAGQIQALMQIQDCGIWGFRMLHFWKSRTHFRVDGRWGEETLGHVHPRLVRNVPSLFFPPQPIHGAHVLGAQGRPLLSDLLIKHYGYAHAEEVVRKCRRYREVDPGGDYEHLLDESGLQLVSYEAARRFLNGGWQHADCD
jgi:glycosyltransferase involved in cell wall biosynthesis